MPTQSKPVYFDRVEGEKPETMPVFWQQDPNSVKFNTPYNFVPGDHPGEVNELPSMTIPNETYTIRELLEKHTRGVMPNVAQEGIYGEEEVNFDSPDLQKVHQMDLYDVQEHLTKTKKLIEQLDENYKSQHNQASKKAEQTSENEVKANSEAKGEQK